MRHAFVLAVTLASGISCVNLEMPKEVAECRARTSCRDRVADASADEFRKDASADLNSTDRPIDIGAAVGDGTDRPSEFGATVVDGGDGPHDALEAGPALCGRDDPSRPTDIVIIAGDKQLGLFWTAVPGASQYRVSRNMIGTGSFTQVTLTPNTSYLDAALTNGVTYYYVVAASKGSCWSEDSMVISGTPRSSTPGPDCSQRPPTSVLASPSGSVQVTLTWTAATPAPNSYSILRSKISDGDYQTIANVAETATAYTDDDPSLVKDTKYYYRVRADGSCAATSPEVSVTPACTSLDAPAPPAVSNSKGTITVAWATVLGATAYSVYRDSSPTGSFAEVLIRNQSTLTYTDAASGLSNGLTYYYKLSASNAQGQCVSPRSQANSAMSCAPPDIPSGIKARPRGSNRVELTWAAAAGASRYSVLRGTSPGAEVDVSPSEASLATTSFTDTGLTVDTTYYYRIRAHNGDHNACASAPSAEVMATPSNCIVLPASKSSYTANTTDAYCFVTCGDLPVGVAGVGLNAVNFSGRTLTINGLSINCPADSDCTLPSDLTKDYTMYPTTGAYVFRVTAGPNTSANTTWWSPKPGRDCQ